MSFQKKEFLIALAEVLGPYKELCDAAIARDWVAQDELSLACLYSLETGGKRFRPSLVWMVQEGLNCHEWKENLGPALACEYFHTASLIADDLPCLDNDDMRRGKPTTHKKFAESTALLASFALISEGFSSIAKTPLPDSQDKSMLAFAISEASRTMGIDGLLGGQMLDLHPQGSSEKLFTMVDKKTGALFELCFVLGWIFGGGSKAGLQEVRTLAQSFGRAFQLIDDIDDYEQDLLAKKDNNYAVLYGLEKTEEVARSYILAFRKGLKALQLEGPSLSALADAMLKAL